MKGIVRAGAGRCACGEQHLSTPKFFLLRSANHVDFSLYDDAIEPPVMYQVARLGAFVWIQSEHRPEEGGDRIRLLFWEEVLVMQDGI